MHRSAKAFRSAPQRRRGAIVAAGVGIILVSSQTLAQPPPEVTKLPPPLTRPVDFAAEVRPIFESTCFGCHGPEKQKSDFRLDSKASALRGGQTGLAILPGNSAGSPLIHYVAGLVEDMQMPPRSGTNQPLTAAQVALLRGWIDQGADWPESQDKLPEKSKSEWWSFQPVIRPCVPQVSPGDWVRNEVDHFILETLQREGLTPSAAADRRTLIRRVTYDLIGLPPTPEETAAFLGDDSAGAYERLVDRLLASPRYGERWARHWLDTVHFGETHGYDKDKTRPNAWPYRDYVIRSFNQDKPYSRFVEEQIAGDILYPDDPDGVLALGFLAAGPWDFVGHVELPESKTDGLIARYNDRDDMIMTTMSTFQSLTVHCARCHDHKFDPIPQEEYYGLQAVFAGIDRADRWFDHDPVAFVKRKKLLAEKQELSARQETLQARVVQASPALFQLIEARQVELNKQLGALSKSSSQDSPGNGERLPSRDPAEEARLAARRSALQEELQQLGAERQTLVDRLVDQTTRLELAEVESRLTAVAAGLAQLLAPGKVYAATPDFSPSGNFKPPGQPRPVHVLRRGEVKQPLHLARAGALSCVPGLEPVFVLKDPAAEGERRAALARWITASTNMLTRRSIVNRIWQYHFGRGIVETANDFGHMGARPTHPELLDWLAFWFVDEGESLKKLHRLLVTSATYRQGSTDRADGARVDADNRYLWRMNRSRLDAESLRDAMLFIAGRLDFTMGGPSVQQFHFKDDHSPVYDYSRFDVGSPAATRRSVYRFIVRSVPDPFMETMDCPDPSLLAPRRGTTVTALQALALLNDPWVLQQAEAWAGRLASSTSDLSAQVVAACELALNRPPQPREAVRLLAYAREHGTTNLCRVLLNTSEFIVVD